MKYWGNKGALHNKTFHSIHNSRQIFEISPITYSIVEPKEKPTRLAQSILQKKKTILRKSLSENIIIFLRNTFFFFFYYLLLITLLLCYCNFPRKVYKVPSVQSTNIKTINSYIYVSVGTL